MNNVSTNKTERIGIRVDVSTKKLIEQKAKQQKKNLTDFIVDSVLTNNSNCTNNIEYLKFLMDFFERNVKLLQKHDQEYIMENRETFMKIDNIIEKGENNNGKI